MYLKLGPSTISSEEPSLLSIEMDGFPESSISVTLVRLLFNHFSLLILCWGNTLAPI